MSSRSHRKEKTNISSSTPDNIDVLIKKYLQWMQLKNYTPDTLEDNESRLRYFFTFCRMQGIGNVHEITREILERYQHYLACAKNKNSGQEDQLLSPNTQIVYMSAALKFMRWLSKRNLILANPADSFYLKEPTHRLPKNVLTHKEAEIVLNQPNIATPLGIRDRAILETFYSTGIRVSELIRLKLTDVDLEQGIVRVIGGKGRRDRIIPIGQRASIWLDKYLREVRFLHRKGQEEHALFITIFGKPFKRDSISWRLHNYVNSANIGKGGACHIFRHAMATGMLENGADIRYIQEMLGHASLNTTEIYTKVSIGKLKEIHNHTHPAQKEVRHEA